MMAELLDKSGAQAKLEALFKALQERLPEEVLTPMAQEVALDVAMRAPSPDTERNIMMFGAFGSTEVTSEGVDSDGRERFIKPATNYLQPFIAHSFMVDGLRIGIGNVIGLDKASEYEYVNVVNGGRIHNTVTDPFWKAWELGGVFNIVPRFPRSDGGMYPLRPEPFERGDTPIFQMTKAIPARFMFTGTDIDAFVDSTLIPGVKRIVKSL